MSRGTTKSELVGSAVYYARPHLSALELSAYRAELETMNITELAHHVKVSREVA